MLRVLELTADVMVPQEKGGAGRGSKRTAGGDRLLLLGIFGFWPPNVRGQFYGSGRSERGNVSNSSTRNK